MKGETYEEFVEKFKQKKTTDDCYTPPKVYDAVAGWVAKRYNLDRKNFIRPFFPGGNYQKHEYKKDDVVVDNPPFSILSEIVRFYKAKNVRFFLFAPSLTLFAVAAGTGGCYIPCNAPVVYENGALVNTSFVTNLENFIIHTYPDLYQAIKDAGVEEKRRLPKYVYPDNVILATTLLTYIAQTEEFAVKEGKHIRQLDSQHPSGKTLYGGGFIVSDEKAKERLEKEKLAKEKLVNIKVWELSEREKRVVRLLNEGRWNECRPQQNCLPLDSTT